MPEWMMGYPLGWVTDDAIWEGVEYSTARAAQIKACGNGIVPQQLALAVLDLLRYAPPHVVEGLGLAA
jgi:DNA (cytosine-5)-methyltransferase 1